MSKEEIQLLCQQGITLSSPEARPVIGEVLDCLPRLPAVVFLQVVVDPLPVVLFGLPDAPL